MQRPAKFAHTRFLGDKRTQFVYDIDEMSSHINVELIAEIVDTGVGICFAPDTLAEARNRGYTLATSNKTRRYRKPRA